jgi:hypothetical protein
VSRALSPLNKRGVIKFLGTRTVSIVHRNLLEDGERERTARVSDVDFDGRGHIAA